VSDVQELLGFPVKSEAALTAIVGPGFIACSNIGVAPLGDIWLRRRGDNIWEARQHVQIMTSQPGDEECAGMNPFDDKFVVNYARGVGLTQKAAVEALAKDRRKMAESLFA
jgi:hypothetical protein